MKVYTMLAEGFEEVEALAVVDVLMRAGIEVSLVSVMPELVVEGAHGIRMMANEIFEKCDFSECDMIFLPGGMPGTRNLDAHEGLREQIRKFHEEKKWLAAICAAPSVFGGLGILEGKKAICFPGFEEKLLGAKITDERVVRDGHIFTSKGMGTAIDLGLAIAGACVSEEKAEELAKTIQYK